MTAMAMPDTVQGVDDRSIEYYRTNGFLRVREVLSTDEVERYAHAARRYVDDHRSESYATGDKDRIFTQLVNVWQRDDTLRELTTHPGLAGIATQLAGMPLRLWHDQLLVKQPHNEAATEAHQDRPYWPHATSRHSLSAWVALVDVPAERGCMTFLPGSHDRSDLRKQDLSDSDDLFRADPTLRWTERVTVPLRAGDCTFHHSYVGHLAGPNRTDDPRFAQVVVYMDADTTYDGSAHIVTDDLGLAPGAGLGEPTFPAVRAQPTG